MQETPSLKEMEDRIAQSRARTAATLQRIEHGVGNFKYWSLGILAFGIVLVVLAASFSLSRHNLADRKPARGQVIIINLPGAAAQTSTPSGLK